MFGNSRCQECRQGDDGAKQLLACSANWCCGGGPTSPPSKLDLVETELCEGINRRIARAEIVEDDGRAGLLEGA